MRSVHNLVITNAGEVHHERINNKPYIEALIKNKAGTRRERVPTHAAVREAATAAAS